MSDWDNIINSTAERSREEGREEGRAETVRKMLASGIPAEVIAGALDITVEKCLSYRAGYDKRLTKVSLCLWSGRRGSNSRPQPWQGCALPTELLPHN